MLFSFAMQIQAAYKHHFLSLKLSLEEGRKGGGVWGGEDKGCSPLIHWRFLEVIRGSDLSSMLSN